MEERIMAELRGRILRHATAHTPPTGTRYFQDTGQLMLAALHTDTRRGGTCCHLYRNLGLFPKEVDSGWQVGVFCTAIDCVVGRRLLWTTAGRFAPPLTQPSRVPTDLALPNSQYFEWPEGIAGGTFGACVGCGKITRGESDEDFEEHRNDCLCGADACYAQIAGFVHGAFAWWALSVAQHSRSPLSRGVGLIRDVRAAIGSQLAGVTRPKWMMPAFPRLVEETPRKNGN